jgi:hypothetical protein
LFAGSGARAASDGDGDPVAGESDGATVGGADVHAATTRKRKVARVRPLHTSLIAE